MSASLWISALAACGAAVWGSDVVGRYDADDLPEPTREEGKQESFREEGRTEISGGIRLAGSTSMARLSLALAERFMEIYPKVTVTVEFTGSGAGIRDVASGITDIGNASRTLTEEERAAGVVENVVALDGIAVCVDPDNPVAGLTMDQLALIYTGGVNNWALVGGRDLPVVVIGREAGSGTRAAFEKQAGVEELCAYANELDSSGAVMAKVASTPGAIGYISLETAKDSVKLLKLDDAEASAENIREGRYKLVRPCIMATKGEIVDQSQVIQVWFEFVLGEEGQRITEEIGLAAVGKEAVFP